MTKHNHGPNFGKKLDTCPRCIELKNGAKPIQWNITKETQETQRLLQAIRNHNCLRSHCGPVCTAFQH